MIKGALTGTGAKGLGGELPGQVFYGIQGPAGPVGDDYVLTDADKAEIAEMAADLVEVPEHSGGNAEDGFSPIATVTQTASGAVITITDKDGTTTATITNGKDGKDGADGQPGKDGADGAKGDKGDTGEKGAPGKDGVNGVTPHVGSNGNWFIGETDTGIPTTGPAGGQGLPGTPGEDGKDGTSATHSWNGTVLTITSASGTSSADLKGAKGDKGDKGDTGAQGPKGDTGSKGDKGDTGATGATGEDGKTPVRGVDYYTDADKAEMETYIATELAKRNQLAPEFAESMEWLEANGDKTKLYVLNDKDDPNYGMIYAYMVMEKEVESGPSYTNLLPNATDTDRTTIYGADYDGDGDKDGYLKGSRLSSSGTISSQADMAVTGFIPATVGNILRIKGTKPRTAGATSSYIITYDSSNTKVGSKTIGEVGDHSDWTNPSDGRHTYENGILTVPLTSANFGTGFNAVRFSAGTIDENTIVTINEEIKEGGGSTIVTVTEWASTGHAFVPADYENRIIAVENRTIRHTAEISALRKAVESGGTDETDEQALQRIREWNPPIYDNAEVFMLSTEKTVTDTQTVEAVYAKYDALMVEHPNYITKTDLGLASDGSTHIYRYDFCEPRTRKYTSSAYHPDLAKPKAIIVSGIHLEYAGIYALYYALEEIANNAELYHDIRRNTHLIVVPCMNPYCLDIGNYSISNGRKNANGVEIHRNFEVDHVVIDSSSNNYGGESPLSEVESQYIDNIMSENPDAAFFLTCHNFDTDTTFGTGFIWPSVATNYMYNMGSRLVDKMSRAWFDKYGASFRDGVNAVKTDKVTDGDYTVGQVGISSTPGTETKHAMKYGIHGANVEIAKLFKVMEPTVTEPCSSQVMSRGAEVYINFLRMAFGCYDHKDKKEYAPNLPWSE